MPILEAILLPSSFELNGPGSIFHLHSLPPNHTTQLDFRPSFLVSFSRWLPGITLPLSTHRIISLPVCFFEAGKSHCFRYRSDLLPPCSFLTIGTDPPQPEGGPVWHEIACEALGMDNPDPIGIAGSVIDHHTPALILRCRLLQLNHRFIKPLQHILLFAIVD